MVSDWSHILPGPVSRAMKIPSPPNSAFLMPRMKTMSKLTDASNMPIWPGWTCSDSPGCKS